METIASTRKKARDIESLILSGIAQVGQSRVADAIGVHESQISRWKSGMVSRMAELLDAIGYDVTPSKQPNFLTFSGDEAVEVAKALRDMLSNLVEKNPQL